MSRLIVKNLPREIKEEKLKTIFAAQGEITDIQLKYTTAGVFRRFAFVGYCTEKEAQRALKFFDSSFIDSSRLQVEIAKDLGDSSLQRPWSKYSQESSAFQKKLTDAEEKKTAKENKKAEKNSAKSTAPIDSKEKKPKKRTDFKELEAEPGFQEFVEAHKGRAQKAVWGNDVSLPVKKPSSKSPKVTTKQARTEAASDDDSDDDDDDDDDGDDDDSASEEDKSDHEDEDMVEEEAKEEINKVAHKTSVSDMDYLKSKMKKPTSKSEDASSDSSSSSGDVSSSDSVSDSSDTTSDEDEEEMDSGKGTTSESDSSENEETSVRTSVVKETTSEVAGSQVEDQSLLKTIRKGKKINKGEFVVKMIGIPYTVEEKNIVEFFHPLNLKSIRVPVNENGQSSGIAFAEFTSEEDVKEALKRHKDYMDISSPEEVEANMEGQQHCSNITMMQPFVMSIFLYACETWNPNTTIGHENPRPRDDMLPKNLLQFLYRLHYHEMVNKKGSKSNIEYFFAIVQETQGKRYVELYRHLKEEKTHGSYQDGPPPWAKQAAELENSGDIIADTGRLFIRNLAYICREEDLESLFSKYGPLTEVNLPVDSLTKKIKGFAFITFMMPEHAVKAFTELDGTTFQGRMLHVLPGKEKKTEEENYEEGSSFKNQKKAKDKAMASSSHNWNSLFISTNAVADAMAEKYQTTKGQVLDASSNRSLAVRMALGETQIVAETRQFLLDNGVALDSFSQPSDKRCKTVMLAKNLPAGTKAEELRELFDQHGSLGRVILPPAGVTAIVEFIEPTEARTAFYRLAYTKHVPLYLEWAPGNVFGEVQTQNQDTETNLTKEAKTDKKSIADADTKTSGDSEQSKSGGTAAVEANDDEDDQPNQGCTIFIKNLNFETTEDTLRKKFSKCGALRTFTVSRKKDPNNPGQLLSMGYGFVEFKKEESAKKAIKNLQHCQLDGHTLEIKLSNRATMQNNPGSSRKQAKKTTQTSTKIMVRNIPFEASQNEVKELFSTFGEIKAVRLPKKMSGTGRHRGFGFVDFLSKQDAKRAFDALCHSSHLYGRRLVLEWAETEESIDTLREKTAAHFNEGGPAKKFKKSNLLDELNSRLLDS